MSAELTAILYDSVEDYPATPVGEITVSDAREFMSNLRDAGQGSVTLQNTAAVQPQAGNLIEWLIRPRGSVAPQVTAFASLVQRRKRTTIDVGEEQNQKTTVEGPGHLAVTTRAPIRPPGGAGRAPRVDTVVYNWVHPDYDDSGWATATNISGQTVASAKLFWPILWADDMPDGSGGGTQIVGPSTGTITSAPVGDYYLRDTFSTTYDGIHILFATIDNTGQVYIDGKLVAGNGSEGNPLESGFTRAAIQPLSLSAGTHTIAIKGTNWPIFGGVNPTGVAANIYIPGYPPTLVWQSIASAMKIEEYPAEEPGMTVGTVIRLAVEQVQNELGLLMFLDLSSFDDVNDSAGNPWDYFANITAQVGRDTIYNLIQKLQAVYADIVMEPSSWRIMAYNWGTLTPASGVTLARGVNVTHLEHTTEDTVADGLLTLSDALGWSDQGSPSYAQAFLEVGSEINGAEVVRLAAGVIDTEDHAKTQVDVAFETKNDDDYYPWWNPDFVPGSTGVVPDEDGSPFTERWLGIGVAETAESERAIVTVVAKDRVQDDDERFIQQLRA